MFGDAIKQEMENRASAQKLHEAVMAAMPEDPPRGSYYWWAKICRENTGAHFLDSGGAYGRHWSSSIKDEEDDPISLYIMDGKLEYSNINTAHFLTELLDADDEIAEALEAFLYWVGEWLRPKLSWGECLDQLWDDLREYREHDFLETYSRVVGAFWDLADPYDLLDYQRKLDRDTYIQTALEEFPSEKMKVLFDDYLFDLEENQPIRGDNTYNSENDFGQGFIYTPIGDDRDHYGWEYVVIQTHNGCDVRGGYATPVIAAFRDTDYFFNWVVDFYCQNCHESWEMSYDYTKAMEKFQPTFDPEKIRSSLMIMEGILAGQKELFPLEPWQWPLPYSPELSKKLLEMYEEDPEEFVFPQTLHNGEPIVDNGNYQAQSVQLLCPKCGHFSVNCYNPVYGF